MINGLLLTPFPMKVPEQAEVEAHFSKLMGRPIRLTQRIDRSLLGGICVTVDGNMYDGSLRARLMKIKHVLEDSDEEVEADASV